MPVDRTDAALLATAQAIVDDDAFAAETGAGFIPPDEVIVEPNPTDYMPPTYLETTAPHLAGAFGDLLGLLRDLNARFVGDLTLDVQAALSMSGEHEELEEGFLGWCQRYFAIRG